MIKTKNRATRIITMTVGIILALASFEHGFFEALQGNKTTDGMLIQAIGDNIQMWQYGTEEAFTVIPNFLITGILTMIISLGIMVWSIGFIDKKKYGSPVFLALFILVTLIGGGLGFIPFYLVTWGYSTRIHKPLTGWAKIIKPKARKPLSGIWKFSLPIATISWIVAVFIAIVGYVPKVSDPEIIINICWSLLFASFVFINISYISGFADDLQA